MEDIKRLGLPILLILISAFLVRLFSVYLPTIFTNTLATIFYASILFMFGITLHRNMRKRSNAVFRKVIAILGFVMLLFYQLNVFTVSFIDHMFAYLGIQGIFLSMLYIYFGYVFVD